MEITVSPRQDQTDLGDRLSLREAARELKVSPGAMTYLVVGAGVPTRAERYGTAKTIAREDLELLRDRLARRDAS